MSQEVGIIEIKLNHG